MAEEEEGGRISLLNAAAFGAVAVVALVLDRITRRIFFGVTGPGRLARRIQATTGYGDVASRLAELHLEDSRRWTKWFAATAIHSAVSIAEEMALRLSGLQRTTLEPVVKNLEGSGTINDDLARRLRAVYIKRHVIRGAGHGVGEADPREAKRIVDEALAVTSLLLLVHEHRHPERRGGIFRGWSAIF